MRALILTVSAGSGHNKAAEAIKEAVLRNEPGSEVRVINTIKYISPTLDKLVIGTYLKSIKYYPVFFKYLYKYADNRETIAVTRLWYEYVTKGLIPTIEEFNPDVIVATHPFTSQILSMLKKNHSLMKPGCVVMTDFGAHSFWVHRNIEAYVVSNDDMIDELKERGIEEGSIHVYGIPTGRKFSQHPERSETLSELGLMDKRTITVMGGSLGLGNIESIVRELLSVDCDLQLIVVSGGNHKLHERMTELNEASERKFLNLTYVDNMDDILRITDLLVTKPGGLTVAESFVTGTPLAIFSAVPGQEAQNAAYLLRHDLALDIGAGTDCRDAICSLMKDEMRLARMKARSREHSKQNAADDVYALLKRLASKNEAII